MIEVTGLTKYFGDRAAVADVSFSVPTGQVLGFLGPNGAGKSTTMRILTGYISASAGTASVAGFEVFDNRVEVCRRVGYLPENTPLYPEMRVVDYLGLMCKLRGVPPSRRQRRIDHAVEACGLTARRRDVIGRLSRGLRQRVGLAQSIVHDPDVLILDEPTAGLDPAQTAETRALIKSLGGHHTVVLSSHILPEVSATCERVVIINEGKLVADDTPDELARRLSRGGAEVEMLIRGKPATVRRRLAAVPAVQSVDVEDTEDGLVSARVRSQNPEIREELARAMVGGRLGLLEMKVRSLSLEDVFLQLTTDEAEETD